MNANRRFNSIARRIQRSWQWKRLRQLIFLNLLALLTCLAAYLYARETAITGVFAAFLCHLAAVRGNKGNFNALACCRTVAVVHFNCHIH